MPASDIGIDLGTRNSLAYSTGKGLVLNEPSIVVYDKNTEKIRAIGEEARMMEGRITSDMEIIRPIRQGVIVDYTVTEKMLKYFIFKVKSYTILAPRALSYKIFQPFLMKKRLQSGDIPSQLIKSSSRRSSSVWSSTGIPSRSAWASAGGSRPR